MKKKEQEPCGICGGKITGLKVEVLGLSSPDWDDLNLEVVADMRLCGVCGEKVLDFVEAMKVAAEAETARKASKRKKRE